MKQFPKRSTADSIQGITFVFHDEDHIIRIWCSTLTGKEKIFVNDDLILEKRNLTRLKTIYAFEAGSNHYELELHTRFSLAYDIQAFLFRNGLVIGGQVCKMDALGQMEIEAVGQLEEAQERHLERNRSRGYKALQEYDLDIARQACQEVLSIFPDDPESLLYMACLASLEERYEDGVELLDRALSNGLKGRERLLTTDFLAFIRIQPAFEAFRQKWGF